MLDVVDEFGQLLGTPRHLLVSPSLFHVILCQEAHHYSLGCVDMHINEVACNVKTDEEDAK